MKKLLQKLEHLNHWVLTIACAMFCFSAFIESANMLYTSIALICFSIGFIILKAIYK